jgi:hypothetical protein
MIQTTGTMDNQDPVNGLDTNLFESGGRVCFHNIEITGAPGRYTITIDGDLTRVGLINVTGVLTDTNIIYEDPTGICYEGSISQTSVTNLSKI